MFVYHAAPDLDSRHASLNMRPATSLLALLRHFPTIIDVILAFQPGNRSRGGLSGHAGEPLAPELLFCVPGGDPGLETDQLCK